MYLETGEKIHGKVVTVLPINEDVIEPVETLGKTKQEAFRASWMLQYEWRPGHDVAANDANIDVPKYDKNLLVPDPVEQQHIVQYPNPFEILANDEDSENGDDKAQQILPDQIKIRDQKTQ